MESSITQSVCIVLSERRPDDEPALAPVRSSGYRVVHSTCPYQAMAELCLSERGRRSSLAWVMNGSVRVAMIVIEPSMFDESDMLVRAVQRYAPEVAIHMVREHVMHPPFSATPREKQADGPEPQPLRSANASVGIRPPALRLAGDDVPHPQVNENPDATGEDEQDENDENAITSRQLTAQEIAMLLGSDTGESGGTGETGGTAS